ncbi:MAG: acyltransferase family protein, partial [Aquiluna sp.]
MRLHSLDAARGSLMILGVLFHALVFVYLFQEPASLSEFLAVVFTHQLLHSFRMPAFFMIAGFFALLLIDKRGR